MQEQVNTGDEIKCLFQPGKISPTAVIQLITPTPAETKHIVAKEINIFLLGFC